MEDTTVPTICLSEATREVTTILEENMPGDAVGYLADESAEDPKDNRALGIAEDLDRLRRVVQILSLGGHLTPKVLQGAFDIEEMLS